MLREIGLDSHIGHVKTGKVVILTGILATTIFGCNSAGSPKSGDNLIRPLTGPARSKVPTDPWILTCGDASATEPALLWNGLIGLRIGRDGTGTGQPFLVINQYDAKGEEKIQGFASPDSLRMTAGSSKVPLNPVSGTDYRQTLDMRSGLLTTQWKQSVEGADLGVKSEHVIDPSRPVFAERWTFTTTKPIQVDQHLDPFQLQVSMRNSWNGGEPVKAGSFTTVSNNAEGFTAQVGPEKAGVAEWTMAVAGFPTTGNTVALSSFTEAYKASEAAWQKKWNCDIELDGPVEDQQAIRSFLFYLRSSISPKGNMSVSPFGLSQTQYNGHVFWDADLWVFPALALIDPEVARVIPEYRLNKKKAASENYLSWIKEGRPTAGPKLGAIEPTDGGLKYPWESSVSGHETVVGPSKFEDHITGDVAWTARLAGDLGLIDSASAAEIVKGAGVFYRDRSVSKGAKRELTHTMSPDENHTGNNDLFTNLLAQWCVNGGTWSGNSPFVLPRDAQGFLTYDGDAFKGYKQAAGVLAIYPLQYPQAEKEAKQMMDRFSDKVTKNGPAMTDSVHSVIWSRLGNSDKAYEAWKDSWESFTRGPLLLFSEKRSKPMAYFVTGAAGSLQSVVYGMLGFRIDYVKESGAAWTSKLQNGNRWLSIKPNLPKAWKSVKFKNFTLGKRRYSLTVTQTAATVSPGE